MTPYPACFSVIAPQAAPMAGLQSPVLKKPAPSGASGDVPRSHLPRATGSTPHRIAYRTAFFEEIAA